MDIRNIPTPDIYRQSSDFRFFLEWIATCLDKTRYDTEKFFDLYDPLRCPKHLLWLLGDTIGFKYDDRLIPAFNRLVILYFASMIHLKGSKDGVTLAAEVNLAQFRLNQISSTLAQITVGSDNRQYQDNYILKDRLEDTHLPVNSVYVTPHTREGYIDVVYFSDERPIDACIEYVRPLGMYLFQNAGVRCDSRTKITIDAKLADMFMGDTSYDAMAVTHVGHYSRKDYASLQQGIYRWVKNESTGAVTYKGSVVSGSQRRSVGYRHWYTNESTLGKIDPGMRALYSLQLSNNEQVVKSLIQDKLFELGEIQEVAVSGKMVTQFEVETEPAYQYSNKSYSSAQTSAYSSARARNLLYDKNADDSVSNQDVLTFDNMNGEGDKTTIGRPVVNPIMSVLGEALSIPKVVDGAVVDGSEDNTKYTKKSGDTVIVDDTSDDYNN